MKYQFRKSDYPEKYGFRKLYNKEQFWVVSLDGKRIPHAFIWKKTRLSPLGWYEAKWYTAEVINPKTRVISGKTFRVGKICRAPKCLSLARNWIMSELDMFKDQGMDIFNACRLPPIKANVEEPALFNVANKEEQQKQTQKAPEPPVVILPIQDKPKPTKSQESTPEDKLGTFKLVQEWRKQIKMFHGLDRVQLLILNILAKHKDNRHPVHSSKLTLELYQNGQKHKHEDVIEMLNKLLDRGLVLRVDLDCDSGSYWFLKVDKKPSWIV
jgi:hypothetical protein